MSACLTGILKGLVMTVPLVHLANTLITLNCGGQIASTLPSPLKSERTGEDKPMSCLLNLYVAAVYRIVDE